MTGSVNSVIAVCKIHVIQIKFHNFILTVTFFEFPRKKHLLHLVLPRLFRLHINQLGKLHGNRTSTLRASLRFFQFRHDCGFDRTHECLQIHTVMLVKLLVLNTDNRCDKILWNILVFDILRILVSPSFRDQFSVFIKNGAGL